MKTLAVAVLLTLSASTASATTIMLSAESNGVRSCGYYGPRIWTYVNGFNADGTIHGVVVARGQCPCSGRGCTPYVYWKTTARNWALDGTTISTPACNYDCAYSTTFTAADAYGNTIYDAQVQTVFGYLWRGMLDIPTSTPFDVDPIVF